MRAGAYTQNALRAAGRADAPPLAPANGSAWERWAAREALGLEDRIGSVEVGKEADLIVVDPAVTLPLEGVGANDDEGPDEMLSRLIFRAHPSMVRGAWVRGRLLPCLIVPASARLPAMDRVIQILINAGALYVADFLIGGIHRHGRVVEVPAGGAGLQPAEHLCPPDPAHPDLPISVITLGIFLLVINAAMLLLTSAISDQLTWASRSTTSARPSWARSWSRSWAGSCRSWRIGVGRTPTRAL